MTKISPPSNKWHSQLSGCKLFDLQIFWPWRFCFPHLLPVEFTECLCILLCTLVLVTCNLCKITVFWVVTPFNLVERYQHFWRTYSSISCSENEGSRFLQNTDILHKAIWCHIPESHNLTFNRMRTSLLTTFHVPLCELMCPSYCMGAIAYVATFFIEVLNAVHKTCLEEIVVHHIIRSTYLMFPLPLFNCSIYSCSINPDTGRHHRIWNKSNTI
jgi:hypothetical protein